MALSYFAFTQLYGLNQNINRTGGTSTARGEHQLYEREHQPHERNIN
ncbi:hypothetical protein [Virgibacillus ihumii]|nr:hypothetical protein [Virgibacillus ihumii]